MATFVLVHGAWHGGWCWEKLTPFYSMPEPLAAALLQLA